MKAKKVAILLVSTSLAMGTVGTMTVFADPPAMGSEAPQAPEQDFSGEKPQAPNGEAPQAPEQDCNGEKKQASDGEAPQAPNGEAPQAPNGETPQAPDGQAPQAPNGEAPNDQNNEAPQAPNGQASQAPDGQAPTNIVKITAIENGNATVEIRNMTGKPDEANSNEETSDAETKNYDFSSAEIVKESNGKKEAATLSDITADSMVELELNEDGSVKTVIIKEKPEGQAPDGKAPNGQAPDNKASTNQTSEEKTSDNTAS